MGCTFSTPSYYGGVPTQYYNVSSVDDVGVQLAFYIKNNGACQDTVAQVNLVTPANGVVNCGSINVNPTGDGTMYSLLSCPNFPRGLAGEGGYYFSATAAYNSFSTTTLSVPFTVVHTQATVTATPSSVTTVTTTPS